MSTMTSSQKPKITNRSSQMRKKSMMNNKAHHHRPPCTRNQRIASLLLVFAACFFFIRSLDRTFRRPCIPNFTTDLVRTSRLPFTDGGDLSWPQRGYGVHLDLKIYVYEEDEVDGLKELMYGKDGNTITADTCSRGQWATQVKIHKLLQTSKFRTRKKEEADLFFVPTYVKCVHVLGGLDDNQINETYIKVLSQMPYFRLSGGRNHIFVFPSGNGAHFFSSWATYINRSIFLTPEGDRTDKKETSSFNTWKDIIIPGNVDDGMTTTNDLVDVQPLPLSKRKYLANYIGRAQGKLESPDLKFTFPDKLEKMEYFEHLRNAKFCLVPRGESSWTLRFFESFFVECVPVILSDQIELPFQNVIDYTQISIKWPSDHIGPQLLEYLESIPDEAIENMISNGRKVRCLWVYAPESAPCSAMQGIMWELQRKVRQFHHSAETFWLHNGSIMNRNFVKFSDWKPPMPLP
ncbi:hypothetical protein FEM48_Zijuj06G0198800 [Ziziphus jujuba var. spinosa]|uniref:Exostosin GT47 domain-containing protein n=1 Tax=Ziziphus jujuba var. spinosa TaxID=714518 RepID=A0A978VBA5_ZIZJJ|nr:hypothetical protein FEM48_Zijuj06G0198800 [Ziziphus jujuba var. spinosa]